MFILATRRSGFLLPFFAALLVGLVAAPFNRAEAFFDAFTCGMDPLHDYCLARELLAHADTMPEGLQHDIAVVYAFAGQVLSTRYENESETILLPNPNAYSDRMQSDQLARIVWIVQHILHNDNFERAMELFVDVRHHGPRMIAYPLILQSMHRTGLVDEAEGVYASFEEELAELPSPAARFASYGELAWIAAQTGRTAIAERAMAAANDAIAQHPSPDFRAAMLSDLAPSEQLLGESEVGAQRVDEARSAVERLEGLPDQARADLLARIARSYGRMGLEDQGRAVAQETLGVMGNLDANQKVRVYSVLVFSRFPF